MTTLNISCNYELSEHLKNVIGYRLQRFVAPKGSVCITGLLTFSNIGDLILIFYEENQRSHIALQLSSRGHESYAGNLYGVEITIPESAGKRYDEMGFPLQIIGDFGKIVKVVGLGETRREDVPTAGDEEDISSFFPKDYLLPDVISIDKKTLEVIGFLSDNGNWLYIFADGEGYFRVEFNTGLSPEELTVRWDYLAMEKQLRVLQVFE